jgi:putative restriction endonuclease
VGEEKSVPATQPVILVDAILEAIQESGHSAILISGIRQHPRKFLITAPDGGETFLFVYAWTLTHGGRTRLPDEYRIQITSVQSPLHLSTEGSTILIGYEPNLKMFAGFDLNRHKTFTTGSPSVQIDIRSVRKAIDDGIAFDRKSNDEIAVGVRPDQLLNYAYNAEHLHKYGKEPNTLRLLSKASSLESIPSADFDALSEPRQRIVQTLSRLSRAANFRIQVLNAYGNRCAVTRAQLRLIDAAHILPVGAPGSVDHVRNGIALSPTFHRAYDATLIYLDEELKMKINPRRETELSSLRLDGGLAEFKNSLGRIHLPADKRQWPDISFISKANRYRLIPRS